MHLIPHSFLGLPFHPNLFDFPLLSLWPLLSPSRCPAPSPQMYWIEWKAMVEMMPLIVKGVRMKKKGGLRRSSCVLGVAMTLMKPPALLRTHLLPLLTHCCSRPLSQPPPAPRAPLASLTPALSQLLWVKSPPWCCMLVCLFLTYFCVLFTLHGVKAPLTYMVLFHLPTLKSFLLSKSSP